MILGILREPEDENRVAMLPGEVAVLKKMGIEVLIEHHAGEKAYIADDEYTTTGAEVAERSGIIAKADFLLSVNHLPDKDLSLCRNGQIICSVLDPVENRKWLESVRERGLTMLALDLVPRITRAQSMDILSSMATVAGYKAVLEAASRLPRFFPMFMSAAGTIRPARVLILGAGVAGLQATAIARKLGAVVEVFDVRSAVREEVRSLGGKFIEVEGAREDASAGGYAVEQTEEFRKKQQELIQQRALVSDVIITTAQIPGKKAPVLIPGKTVKAMKPGSVIVDLAAHSGGNCELTKDGMNITVNGVTIVGKTDYPSEMPTDASKMFGNNVLNLLKIMVDKDGNINLDLEDEIISGTIAVHGKEYIGDRIKQLLNIN
jgi:NAD(P) transhydrogenase subunit alpha